MQSSRESRGSEVVKQISDGVIGERQPVMAAGSIPKVDFFSVEMKVNFGSSGDVLVAVPTPGSKWARSLTMWSAHLQNPLFRQSILMSRWYVPCSLMAMIPRWNHQQASLRAGLANAGKRARATPGARLRWQSEAWMDSASRLTGEGSVVLTGQGAGILK